MIRQTVTITLAALTAAMPYGCRSKSGGPPPEVATTNSFLGCAVKDLLGPETPVLSMAGPNMCPSHFDIRPSQIRQLHQCRLLLRLDFQNTLDEKFAGAVKNGLRIVPVHIPGGLCEPDSYLAACRQTADALVKAGLLDRPTADRRLKEIENRVNQTTDACRQKLATIEGLPVVTSTHQAAFCRWLGLNVVATFGAADTVRASQIEHTRVQGQQAGVKLLIANRPEGRRLADSLAEKLKAKVVMFDNFPENTPAAFDALLTNNVNRLLEAVNNNP